MRFPWQAPARSTSSRCERGANPWAGEVAVRLGGRAYPARLTLAALAELEGELGAESMVALVERFEGGRFSARDIGAVLVAGLRGGGWQGESAECLAGIEASPAEAAELAARLLARAFRIEGT